MRTSWWMMFAAVAGCGGNGASDTGPSGRTFTIALAADSHVIDEFYTCCESNDLDTTSLQSSEARLRAAIEAMNAVSPRPEALFVAGDVVHEFPSSDLVFYDSNRTSMDIAKEVYDGLSFPYYLAMGNHDYDLGVLTREQTHILADQKWGLASTYYAVEIEGFNFLVLDGQLGPTWDGSSAQFDSSFASFGDAQLAWLDQELSEGKPSFLFFHHPPNFVRRGESQGAFPDLFAVLEAHDNVEAIFTGHMHLWMNTSTVWDPNAETPETSRIQGYGLAATRYDKRNWWLMELDPSDMSWSLPQANEVQLTSYFYDGVEPEGL